MSQLTFAAQAAYEVGQIATTNPVEKVTMPVAEEVIFGQVVSDSADGIVAFDTTAMGIVARTFSHSIAADGSVSIPANDSYGAVVVREGYVAVEVLSDVVKGTSAFVGVDGISGIDTGDFTAYEAVAGITFQETAVAGSVVLVRVKL